MRGFQYFQGFFYALVFKFATETFSLIKLNDEGIQEDI